MGTVELIFNSIFQPFTASLFLERERSGTEPSFTIPLIGLSPKPLARQDFEALVPSSIHERQHHEIVATTTTPPNQAIDRPNYATDLTAARGSQARAVSRSRHAHRSHRPPYPSRPPIDPPLPLLQHARQAETIPRGLTVPPIDGSAHSPPHVHCFGC